MPTYGSCRVPLYQARARPAQTNLGARLSDLPLNMVRSVPNWSVLFFFCIQAYRPDVHASTPSTVQPCFCSQDIARTERSDWRYDVPSTASYPSPRATGASSSVIRSSKIRRSSVSLRIHGSTLLAISIRWRILGIAIKSSSKCRMGRFGSSMLMRWQTRRERRDCLVACLESNVVGGGTESISFT